MKGSGELDETVASDSDVAISPTSPSSAATAVALPTSIDRFSIVSKLGEGGMGIVMLATDPMLGRKVALKILRGGPSEDTDDRTARFLREARAMGKLSHESVIVVHEVGTHDGQVFVAMEYVAGTTLTRWQSGQTWREILRVYERAGRGLQAAHSAGLVHRDFKPDNVLIGDDGRVRVTDFGLVAAIDAAHPGRSSTPPDMVASSLTQTGAVLGTPRFMAPEQHTGAPVDARADQFAFCVALYEALYHQPPFLGTTYGELAERVIAGDLQAAPPSDVPIVVHDAIVRGLSRDREDRFASMHALLEVLRAEIAPVSPPRGRRRTWIVLAAVAVVIGAVIGIAYKQRLDAQRATERADELETAVVDLDLKLKRELDARPPPQPVNPMERPTVRPEGLGIRHSQVEFESAQEAYLAGRYEEAVTRFLGAYEFQKFPQFLFNAAVAQTMLYRRDKDPAVAKGAAALYRRYLTDTPDAADRDMVERLIVQLESAK